MATVLNMAWKRLLLPRFVSYEGTEVGSVYHLFIFRLWTSGFCYCSTLLLHVPHKTLQSERVELFYFILMNSEEILCLWQILTFTIWFTNIGRWTIACIIISGTIRLDISQGIGYSRPSIVMIMSQIELIHQKLTSFSFGKVTHQVMK